MRCADAYSVTFDLLSSQEGQLVCNLALSEEVLANHPEESRFLYSRMQEKLPGLWHQLALQIPENRWIQAIRAKESLFGLSVILLGNSEIQLLNQEYRGKNSPTDVLTFTLLDETMESSTLAKLPELDLGEIYISVDWAMEVICKQIEINRHEMLHFLHALTLFVLERLVHGSLHLLGVHHKTLSEYNTVVEIQGRVLHAIA